MHFISGILTGIYPDACTEQAINFLKANCRADILISEQSTLQALLKVSAILDRNWCINVYIIIRCLVSTPQSLRQLYYMEVKWNILPIMFIQ